MKYQDINNDIEKHLAKLCIDFINILDKLKANGVITEKEYNKHIKYKKDFLKKVSFKQH